MLKKRQVSVLAVALIIILGSSSCIDSRKALYFADRKDETVAATNAVPQSVIISSDLLSISVSSLNPEATAIYNAPNTIISATSGSQNTGSSVQTTGYLVKTDGNILFPIVGSVKAAGLTTAELSDQLIKILVNRKLLIDPIVTVRYLNFRVTVLGEVARPAVINVPNEKMSVLEALGLAGDITIFGKKDNVLLIREESGQKLITQLNLNSKLFFQSPYYYLKSNDVIYVEPNKARIAGSTRTTQFLPLLLSGLSFAAIIIDRLTR
jgi:polysaccharide export outer membrane protein